ncbi:MAG: TetR/AcrR family transcriptional regulator [Verrucomicrobia bacterium]|nr:TetR/AcrR family transcriptional regulator [Verrucomicrobiota bacterium]
MKVSREQVAANRRRILQAGSRLFRARGYDSVTVAEVMQAAGLTHGGFYGYFRSKDDLIACALADVLLGGAETEIDLASYARQYLTPTHRDDLAGGCPMAGLGAETVRQTPAARAAMTAGLRRQIDRLTSGAPGRVGLERRRAAIAGYSAMVGALILARMSDDTELSEEILAATRDSIAGKNQASPKPVRRRRKSTS